MGGRVQLVLGGGTGTPFPDPLPPTLEPPPPPPLELPPANTEAAGLMVKVIIRTAINSHNLFPFSLTMPSFLFPNSDSKRGNSLTKNYFPLFFNYIILVSEMFS